MPSAGLDGTLTESKKSFAASERSRVAPEGTLAAWEEFVARRGLVAFAALFAGFEATLAGLGAAFAVVEGLLAGLFEATFAGFG